LPDSLSGDLNGAERYFRDALARRGDYAEAANNVALVLASRGDTDAPVSLLQELLQRTPQYEAMRPRCHGGDRSRRARSGGQGVRQLTTAVADDTTRAGLPGTGSRAARLPPALGERAR
jgi:hypothetical protein